MNRRLWLCFAAILLAGCVSPRPGASGQKIRVLIVDGFSNHDWRQTTALIRGILAPSGLFDVAVSTAPDNTNSPAWATWRPKFSDYDVVIQNCNDIGKRITWPEPVKKDFEDFVRNGGGVYIFHSAENAFVGWKEYEQMVGLCWRNADYGTAIRVNDDGTLVRIPPGEGSGTGHGTARRRARHAPRRRPDSCRDAAPVAHTRPGGLLLCARSGGECPSVLAYARDSKAGTGIGCGRWNGRSPTARAAFTFPPTAMSGRVTCNPPA